MGNGGKKWGIAGKSGDKSWKKWGNFLDDRKSLSIAFLAISDQYATFLFFKMATGGHFGFRFLPKSIGTSLYSMSGATSIMKLIGAFLIKLSSAQAFSSYFHNGFSDLVQNR